MASVGNLMTGIHELLGLIPIRERGDGGYKYIYKDTDLIKILKIKIKIQ